MQVKILAAALISTFLLASCASSDSQKTAPSRLQSSGQLQKDPAIAGAYIYRAPNLDTTQYRMLMLDPTTVYSGPEASFVDSSAADVALYSRIVSEEFRVVLGERYRLTSAASPSVLRIRPTLIGVERTVGGVATATRIIPISLAINAVRGASGGEGSMTGAIELAIEIYDAQTNQLVASTVRRQAPAVFDMEATFSTEDTVRSSARTVAEMLRDAIARRAPQMTRADARGLLSSAQ